MRLVFSHPKKFMFHYSKLKRKVNLFVYEGKNPSCYQVEKVIQHVPSETIELPLASFSVTRGFGSKIVVNDSVATIYP